MKLIIRRIEFSYFLKEKEKLIKLKEKKDIN
jgi:hypothetical protein